MKRDVKKKRKDNKEKGLIGKRVLLGGAVILLLVYVIGIFVFQNRYMFGTEINGIACGGASVEELQDKVIQEAGKYQLEIVGREGATDSIFANEIMLKPVFDGGLESILKAQNAFIWPVSILTLQKYETQTVVSYDEEAFKQKVQNLVFCKKNNQRQPLNARLSEISDDGYQIIPEDEGTTIIMARLTEVLDNAVLTLQDTVDLEQNGCYLAPEIRSDDAKLVAECEKLNKLVTVKITYTFGEDIVSTTPEIISGWLAIDEENYTLVKENVREFVNDIARKYDTFGKRRTFVTHDGEEIDITEGTYGWWMNRGQETDELMEMVLNGESGEREPVYYATAAQYGSVDWGNNYVEIDLTKQHLYVYVDGEEQLESDFVSGNVSKGLGTPLGIYGITYKARDVSLVGQGYSSPVSYWMPFNNNVGMHDATWRKTFGGQIYLKNGSHGCINLPKDIAAQIYDLVEKNTAVIVYGGAKNAVVKPEAENEQKTDEELTNDNSEDTQNTDGQTQEPQQTNVEVKPEEPQPVQSEASVPSDTNNSEIIQ